MADLRSPLTPLIVQLPSELIDEIKQVANAEQLTVDELVMEACLDFTEPRLWHQEHA